MFVPWSPASGYAHETSSLGEPTGPNRRIDKANASNLPKPRNFPRKTRRQPGPSSQTPAQIRILLALPPSSSKLFSLSFDSRWFVRGQEEPVAVPVVSRTFHSGTETRPYTPSSKPCFVLRSVHSVVVLPIRTPKLSNWPKAFEHIRTSCSYQQPSIKSPNKPQRLECNLNFTHSAMETPLRLSTCSPHQVRDHRLCAERQWRSDGHIRRNA